jgi:hypothetical protein
MDIDDSSTNPAAAKLEKFSSSVARHQPIIFCVNCGSTNLDQNSKYMLQCYDCRGIALWDGHSFGIARRGSVQDVAHALTPPANPDYFNNRQSQIIQALHEFGRTAIQSGATIEEWEKCKAKIDGLINGAQRDNT